MRANSISILLAVFCSVCVFSSALSNQIQNDESIYLRRDNMKKFERNQIIKQGRRLQEGTDGKGKGGKGGKGVKGSSKQPKSSKAPKSKGKGGKGSKTKVKGGKGSSKAPKSKGKGGKGSSKAPKSKGKGGKGSSKAPKSSKGPKGGKGGKGSKGGKSSKKSKGGKGGKGSEKSGKLTPAPSSVVDKNVPTISPTKSPTVSTGIPTTAMPTGVCPGFSPQGREDEIRDLLLTITTADVLDDDKSPQAKAIEWLIEEDALEVCPEAQAQIIQRFGLAAFYYSTEGDKWNFCGQEKNDCQGGERFLSSASECDWYGVRCNGGGKVNELKLEPFNGEGIGLKGEIAPEIFFIPNLKDLEIEFFDQDENKRGKLGGTIPATIGNASKLRALDIQKQKLEGSIPEALYDATSLREIDLDSNKLTGTISDSIGKLTNLIFFTAVDNDFDEQEIPSTFSQLTSLKYFGLNNANLVGAVPDGLDKLVQMLFLDLSDNALTGDISFIAGYTKIITIALDNNEFDGDIPSSIWNFVDVEVLNLENNELTGSIPSNVTGLKKIKTLRLANNNMSGTLPDLATTFPDLVTVTLEGNAFTGTVACGGSIEIITYDDKSGLDCQGACCDKK